VPAPVGGDATIRLDAPGGFASIDIGAETMPRLAVSRRFDSTDGLRRLIAGAGPASLEHWQRRRRERLLMTAGVTIAALIALAIALS